ncbi:MAG: 5'/3'-nucleotidase SurE [Pseudomonadota bacterium]
MKILVSNDDGYLATGIRTLSQRLMAFGRVDVVAPDRNQSGASSSLTLHAPLRVTETGPRQYAVNGTPSDCVHLALAGFLDEEPDIVVSGINHGANLGDDVIYSGTVAAAIEGRHLGLPAIAVSLVGHESRHFDTAAEVCARVLAGMQRRPLPSDSILNINVPDVPLDDLRGIRVTRTGFRHRAEPIVAQTDPRGRPVYWIGPAGAEADAGEGTDFAAIEQGYASLTPMQIDLTRHSQLAGLSEWLEAAL